MAIKMKELEVKQIHEEFDGVAIVHGKTEGEPTHLSFSTDQAIAFAKLLQATARKANTQDATIDVWLHQAKESAREWLHIIATL
jgi:hypothetical protein